jgi:signal transduction histidine kinase
MTSIERWRMPRARTREEGRLVAGVAGGIADELGVPPVAVRVAFVVLGAIAGWGVLLYVGCWWVMWLRARATPPDLEPRQPKGASASSRLVGFAMVVVGLALALRELTDTPAASVLFPVALLVAGLTVAVNEGASVEDRPRVLLRVSAGAALVVLGVAIAVASNFSLLTASSVLAVSAVVVVGLALVVAPTAIRLVESFGEERRRRIRSEERAEVAAHLHDSVLQTLTLIQRRSSDPEVVTLARRQERDLRGWLFGEDPTAVPPAANFRSRLEAVAAEVEDREHVPVHVVAVGDATADDEHEALLGAVREAVTNAARHSRTTRVDVYAEAGPEGLDVYVRDHGIGFDPSAVPADRRGVAESIVGRMQRAGGSATIDTRPGGGTEVELHLPRRVPA